MIIIPAILESFRSLKDRTLKISFETQELSPSQMGDIQGSLNKIGFLAFKQDPFKDNEKQLLDSLEAEYDDKSKTPSKRLRSVLYVCWKQDNEGFETFPSFYDHKMEQIINHYKSKLD